MSASEIAPWSERRFSEIDIASSGTDCQSSSTSADAFSGRSTKAPGVTTLAVNSVVVAPATTVTLGCGSRGSRLIRATRTCVVAPSPQRSIRPAMSLSDPVVFALFMIEIEFWTASRIRRSSKLPSSRLGLLLLRNIGGRPRLLFLLAAYPLTLVFNATAVLDFPVQLPRVSRILTKRGGCCDHPIDEDYCSKTQCDMRSSGKRTHERLVHAGRG